MIREDGANETIILDIAKRTAWQLFKTDLGDGEIEAVLIEALKIVKDKWAIFDKE